MNRNSGSPPPSYDSYGQEPGEPPHVFVVTMTQVHSVKHPEVHRRVHDHHRCYRPVHPPRKPGTRRTHYTHYRHRHHPVGYPCPNTILTKLSDSHSHDSGGPPSTSTYGRYYHRHRIHLGRSSRVLFTCLRLLPPTALVIGLRTFNTNQ